MRCYYEELGVARDSNEADIKTAYRKLALRWHPDKNPECLAEAKERFQLIQQAYEVLSDGQERAWYDNHREQILRGKNSDYSENCLDVFPYFTGSCYKGYGNDAQGFYSVYRDVFNKIAAEDMDFMDSDDEGLSAPQFGDANSSYEDVVGPFYAYWLSYSTKKTYEWLCPYDVREIKERFILRKVEKEMKKIVQNARKERNEEIRNLVSFVRKRDRRVQANRRVLEERAEANRLKQEEKRREQLRQRQEQLAAVRANKVDNDGYEEQLRQLEQQYGSESDEYTDEEDEDENEDDVDAENVDSDNLSEQEVEYVDDLYCVACNKSFKNAKARANHDESKKHRDNVERLCQQMEAEEQEFNEHSEELEAAEESLEDLQLNGNHEADLVSDEAANDQTSNKRNKKNKKSKKVATKTAVESDDEDESAPPVSFNAAPSNSEDDDNDDWSRGKKSTKKTKSKKSTTATNVSKQKVEAASAEAKPTAGAPAKAARGGDDTAEATVVQHTCVTCKLSFDSKNKLFAHLKKTNHGVYIPKAKPDVEGKPPGKGKGRRNK
ncbi:PREDICTED: dnaJ homolog subfamily C member 21 [Drosophila arizonae]|uniref:DnaJ homolog subfamily C member 21 n=1 Tax=Drosophila arizonae TaxID=7263 RepID=A0ABM1PD03_DROAR|nr:PREDICTED: dnaJ homolog subfamily C member 21 [Drosophila arizonae]XP_017865089.1 PREDICTED: dnaJ homolog subfamily C member 21 [Drosophila arizonae]